MIKYYNSNLIIRIIYLVFIIFFIINPFLSIICLLLFSFIIQDKRLALFDVILLTLLMWLIQSTRSFSLYEYSDWAGNYVINFNRIRTSRFVDYIFFTGREYAWQIENYIGFLLFKRFLPYGNFIVALTYLFTFLSCYEYWKSTDRGLRTLITSLILFAFISEISALSNNLLRQQLAMSMMLYVLIVKAVHNKIKWFLLFTAFFTHSMTVFFIPALFVNIGVRFSRKKIVYMIVGLLLFMIVIKLASSFTGLYVLERLNTASDYNGTDVMNTSAIYPFLAVVIILYFKIIIRDKCNNPTILFVNNLFLMLILLCLAFQDMPLVQIRYFITRFFFLPLVIPYFFQRRSQFNTPFLFIVSMAFVIRFCIIQSPWLAPVTDIFTRNLFEYSIL